MENITQENIDHGDILTQLNTEEYYARLPVRIFLGCVMAIGIAGNSHVLYIYGRFFKISTYRNFVLSLSVIDMIGCCLSMPFEILDESMPFTFTDVTACKIFRYLNTCVGISCGLTLVLVATERYRKICHPQGKQLSERASIYYIAAAILASFVISSPALYLYGLKTVTFKNYDVKGTECTWADHAQGTSIGYAYFGTAVLVILGCMVTMSILYLLVGIKLRSHGKAMKENLRKANKIHAPKKRGREENYNMSEKRNMSRSFDNLNAIKTPGMTHRLSNSCEILCENRQSSNQITVQKGSNQRGSMENDKQEHVHCLAETKHASNDLADVQNGGSVLVKSRQSGMNHNPTDKEQEQILHHSDNIFGEKCQSNIPLLYEKDSRKPAEEVCYSSKTEETDIPKLCNRQSLTQNKFTRIIRLIHGNGDGSRRESKDSVAQKVIGKMINLFKVDDREKRVTKILFTVTLLFILSFLPYVVILIVYSFDPMYEERMTSSEQVLYLLALRLYNINSAANSILYVLFDRKFRKELKQLYCNILRRIRPYH